MVGVFYIELYSNGYSQYHNQVVLTLIYRIKK